MQRQPRQLPSEKLSNRAASPHGHAQWLLFGNRPIRRGPPASSSAMGQKASMRSTPKNGLLQTIGLRQPEEHFDYITPRTSKLQTPEGRRWARTTKVEERGFGSSERGERVEWAGRVPCPVKSITLLVKTVQRQHKAVLPSKPHRLLSRDLRVGISRTAKHHQRSSRSQNPGQVVAVLGWVGQLVHHDKYLQRETRKHNLFMSLVVDSGSCFVNILMLR